MREIQCSNVSVSLKNRAIWRIGAVVNALGNWSEDRVDRIRCCGGTAHATCGQEFGGRRSKASWGVPAAEIWLWNILEFPWNSLVRSHWCLGVGDPSCPPQGLARPGVRSPSRWWPTADWPTATAEAPWLGEQQVAMGPAWESNFLSTEAEIA